MLQLVLLAAALAAAGIARAADVPQKLTLTIYNTISRSCRTYGITA